VSAEVPPGLDPELLDDFFAEAEQHLISIRQSLLQLESCIGRTQPEPKVLDELFQNFHSFKGISAIAGLGPAETLAHATEEFLRTLTRRPGSVTANGLETLMEVAHKLEQIVSAFRSRKSLPRYESLVADLRQQNEQSARVDAAPISRSSDVSKSKSTPLWKFTFAPSLELAARGTNINSVREELSGIGEVLNARPIVTGKSELSFEFLVSAQDLCGDFAAWEAKGIHVVPVESAPAPLTPEAPESEVEPEQHTPFLAPSHLVRVDLNRLDELMRIAGEMVIQRSRLDAQIACLNATTVSGDLRGVQEASGRLSRLLRDLREAINRVRLVRVAEIFDRMPFVVGDLSRQTRKKVRLKLEGQETAIDKYLIERLKDPLLHLVRNAFSHGVESPEERSAGSKPEEATIELKASTSGDSVVLQVRDDGRGINPERILDRAKQLGLEVPQVVDNQAILNILCAPGFSTREDADRAAGRGIGMAVVHGMVRELGGSLSLESDVGKGTQFTLRLPLTLTIAETLIVSAAGQTCAVPQAFVTEILHTDEGQVQIVNGIEVVPYRNGVLPIVRLAKLFRLQTAAKSKLCLLVITSERGSVGLLTEEVQGRKEVVVRALRDPLVQVPGIAGATELGDGKAVLILDGAALTNGNVRPAARTSPAEELN
jgi:two-component system chemotaxis sensor kinase CheA